MDDELSTRYEVIEKMCNDVSKLGMLSDVSIYMDAVLKREEEIPTSIGFNVSIPHGKSDAVKKPFITFMRTENPFLWDKKNGEEVSLIFMIGVPNNQKDTLHLKILSQISRNLMDENFRETLLETKSKDEVYNLLKSIEENIYQKGEL